MSDLKISASEMIKATMPTKKLGDFDSIKATDGDKTKLQKAAKEFEGIFMDVVMKSMRNTVVDNDIFGDNEKTKFFQEMLDTEYSKMSGDHSKIGLADAIVRQMSPKSPKGTP